MLDVSNMFQLFFPILDTSLSANRMLKTGKSETLDADTHIEVPQDRYGLYAIDMLDPDMVSVAPYL